MRKDEVTVRKTSLSRIISIQILFIFFFFIFVFLSIETQNWLIILITVILGIGSISPIKSKNYDKGNPKEEKKEVDAVNWKMYFRGLTGI